MALRLLAVPIVVLSLLVPTACTKVGAESESHDASPDASDSSPGTGSESESDIPRICLSDNRHQKSNSFVGTCSLDGSCDDPLIRDGTVISSTVLRVIAHRMARDDGSGAVPEQAIADTIAQTNTDLSPYGIELRLEAVRTHSSDEHYCVGAPEPGSETWLDNISAMKFVYAESPETSLNLYVSCIEIGSLGLLEGFATFPWDPEHDSIGGGIWLADSSVGVGRGVLTHEVGHVLGLWHTYHGVTETAPCSDCYEPASGQESDLRGDLVSDTDATPRVTTCSDPLGVDCVGTPWPTTGVWTNYMGAAPESCRTVMTPQQTSRAHCWLGSELPGWKITDTEFCSDGLDNDSDALIDCDDPDCDQSFQCITCPGGSFQGTLSKRNRSDAFEYSIYQGAGPYSAELIHDSGLMELTLERRSGVKWVSVHGPSDQITVTSIPGRHRWKVSYVTGTGPYDICIESPITETPTPL
jgi:hypothetical protein